MLHGWENFFIVGATAGATLIGLLFVAITLGAGLSTPQGLNATRAFLTPTLIWFSGVLFECIAVLPPWPSAWPVGIILGLFGLASLVYQIYIIHEQRKVDFASLDWLDWTLRFSVMLMLGQTALIAMRSRIDCRETFRALRHRGRDHAPAACRHLRRMVHHVVDRQEPGQDLRSGCLCEFALMSEADDCSVNRKVSTLSATSPVCSQLRTNCRVTANVERGYFRKSRLWCEFAFYAWVANQS